MGQTQFRCCSLMNPKPARHSKQREELRAHTTQEICLKCSLNVQYGRETEHLKSKGERWHSHLPLLTAKPAFLPLISWYRCRQSLTLVVLVQYHQTPQIFLIFLFNSFHCSCFCCISQQSTHFNFTHDQIHFQICSTALEGFKRP